MTGICLYSMAREGEGGKRPKVTKNPWSRAEDELLTLVVEATGTKNWTKIAGHLSCRTGKQCRERWLNYLDPSIKREAWSREEDLTLIRLHQKCGNKWAQFTKELPGRTDNAIKNRWNSTLKRITDQYLSSYNVPIAEIATDVATVARVEGFAKRIDLPSGVDSFPDGRPILPTLEGIFSRGEESEGGDDEVQTDGDNSSSKRCRTGQGSNRNHPDVPVKRFHCSPITESSVTSTQYPPVLVNSESLTTTWEHEMDRKTDTTATDATTNTDGKTLDPVRLITEMLNSTENISGKANLDSWTNSFISSTCSPTRTNSYMKLSGLESDNWEKDLLSTADACGIYNDFETIF